MEDMITYPTPSPQPGDLLDDAKSSSSEEVHGMGTETPTAQPYMYHYQYAYMPGCCGSPSVVYPQWAPSMVPVPYSTPPFTGSYQYPSVKPETPAGVPPSTVEPPTIVQTANRQRVVIWNYCQFCQNNREPEEFYKSHILRDAEGKVVCPVLRAYNCPICNNGGGDKAHTKSYCPQLRATGRLTRRN
jgi:protein nanos 1